MDEKRYKHYKEDLKACKTKAFDCLADIFRSFRDDDYELGRLASHSLLNQLDSIHKLTKALHQMVDADLE